MESFLCALHSIFSISSFEYGSGQMEDNEDLART